MATNSMKIESTPSPDVDDVDRISALPDPLICHILSFLPTKESVATSVLSGRWRYLFASVPDFDLTFEPTFYLEPETSDDESLDSWRLLKFLHLTSSILQLRDLTPIRKFKFTIFNFTIIWAYENFRSTIDLLISTTLLYEIQELEICVEAENEPYVITCPGIFKCKSLVYLQLWVHSDIPNSVFLPNLKVLRMYLMGLADDSVQKLIQGCPKLEELSLQLYSNPLEDEDSNDSKVVGFSSPSIKKLEIRLWGGEYKIVVESNILESLLYIVDNYAGQHQVILNAPNLKEFTYWAPVAGVSFIGNLDSLVAAGIGVGWLDDQLTIHDAIDHLYRAQKVKSLSIKQHILEVLYGSQDFLPTFNNLTSLELGPGHNGHNAGEIDHTLAWRTLPSLFEKAPNLEVLTFTCMILDNISESNELESLFLEALPVCFVKQLKKIEFKNFSNQEYEFKLIEYLLQHGKGLKDMIVGQFLRPSVGERILSFKRSSVNYFIAPGFVGLRSKYCYLTC
ncbi:F-box/LRR-repeat protein At4g14103-like [Coffea eugenioides]|uniref:F-box/LRR-repeat protein At4g14103-like n=1 Tax=Coffea eugenioides TaxID=49369 RepID=UPI000F60A108|nr:F-box/LRR-repeat protein At4g14103-like [Coffea eugenioides]